MFTGLVEEVGRVASVERRAPGLRLVIEAPGVTADLAVGDSVSVSGCCLTAVEVRPGAFAVDVVPETLERTTLGEAAPATPVNLERSLKLDQRLGGHLVLGHVDGVGRVAEVREEGEGRRVRFELPAPLARFVAEKGSLAIDGVSLTVAACSDQDVEIAYVPHTVRATVAGAYAPGRRVNLEVDLLARYVARLLESRNGDRS
jgi:riboflavin synthase